jgi:hypothetical protein
MVGWKSRRPGRGRFAAAPGDKPPKTSTLAGSRPAAVPPSGRPLEAGSERLEVFAPWPLVLSLGLMVIPHRVAGGGARFRRGACRALAAPGPGRPPTGLKPLGPVTSLKDAPSRPPVARSALAATSRFEPKGMAGAGAAAGGRLAPTGGGLLERTPASWPTASPRITGGLGLESGRVRGASRRGPRPRQPLSSPLPPKFPRNFITAIPVKFWSVRIWWG